MNKYFIRKAIPFLGFFIGTFLKTVAQAPVISSFSPTAAVSGNTVTFTGLNFSGATAVYFGNQPAASFTVVNNTTITAVVGSGATGVVRVSGPGGQGTLMGFTHINPPNISYPAGTYVFPPGTAISPLNPTNTGGKPVGRGANLLVTTLAGNGVQTFADGAAASASFNRPTDMVADDNGNVYVADRYNHRIRKISSSGVVSTLAGSGSNSFADGTGTAARFNGPTGVAIDFNGNIYVADYSNHRIRKITPAGVVTTVAGSGTSGYLDGAAATARFNSPYGVAVDASGNIYVTEFGNHRVRKITPAGVVSTLAGSGTASFADGTGTAASFNSPFGITVDGNGNVFVGDWNNDKIRKISPDGVVTTYAGNDVGGYVDGNRLDAGFSAPRGVAIDGLGNMYVADQGNNLIRAISAAGVVTTMAGSGTGFADGAAGSASFSNPVGVTQDGNGNVLVADYINHRIRRISTIGGYTISPALPTGLVLDSTTGVISGTPTAGTPAANYVVTATNAFGSSSHTINLAVSGPIVHEFTGSGNWSNAANWKNGLVPPAVLNNNAEIIINPPGTEECVIDVFQTVSGGSKITVSKNKRVRITNKVILEPNAKFDLL